MEHNLLDIFLYPLALAGGTYGGAVFLGPTAGAELHLGAQHQEDHGWRFAFTTSAATVGINVHDHLRIALKLKLQGVVDTVPVTNPYGPDGQGLDIAWELPASLGIEGSF